MGRLDVQQMLKGLDRDEFNKWYVAYHELHLDGSWPAALVASAIHNELMPLQVYLGNDEWEPKTPEQLLPRTIFGDETDGDEPADHDAEIDRMIAAAARAFPS